MILDREQFVDHFNQQQPGLGKSNSPLWEPEKYTKIANEWFVCVKPILSEPSRGENRHDYYKWCEKNLKSNPLCYSSNDEDEQEWWGFKNREDIVIWTLRWIK